MKKLVLLITSVLISVASFALAPISGTAGICVGATTYLGNTDTGGVWSSSDITVATVGSATGSAWDSASCVVTGVAAGTATITYMVGSSYVTLTITVASRPVPITGTTPTCIGATSTLSDATPGGSWSSTNPGVASVSATGVVTGLWGGYAGILYSTDPGCYVSISVDIPALTLDSVSGPSSVCAGSTIVLTQVGTSGGMWTSSNAAIATVDAAGVVTGVSDGVDTITYYVSATCSGSASAYKTITVISTATTAGTIYGAVVTMGTTSSFYDAVPGGIWSSANPAVATIGSATGIVTGVTLGTAVITYSVSGCTGTAYATYTATVAPFDGISGHVLATGVPYYPVVKVWLITYNPATYMLEAIDSTIVSCSGCSSIYYQFPGVPTDSFRIKAAVSDTGIVPTGYVPTYHTSSFYWNSATVLYHTSGTADTNQDINMITGTATSGPGFVAGNVLLGANRGTSGGIPAVGLQVYAINAATNTIVQQAITDASGSYSFTGLLLGSYNIHPEALNYAATNYTGITLTASADSMSAANFIQHTISHTITPIPEAVGTVKSQGSSVVVFPNPTSGKLNIAWNETATENGTVTITDITGREVYNTVINMNAGAGIHQLDLSGLVNGLYIINIKSGDINYNSKIQVAK